MELYNKRFNRIGKNNIYNGNAGGIVGKSVGNIYNCCNKATVQGYGYTGGIGGAVWGTAGVPLVINCKNEGDVTSTNYMAGGITGDSSGEITNCSNTGKVIGYSYARRNNRRITK